MLWNGSNQSISDHSKECMYLVDNCWSSLVVLATGFSCWPNQFFHQISVRSLCFLSSNIRPYIVWTSKNSSLIRIVSLFNTKLNPVKSRSLWDLLLLLKKCYYFSSTWIIVSIFLLYILLLCSTGEKNLLKKAIRCHLPFSLDAWGRTSSIAKLELFTSI